MFRFNFWRVFNVFDGVVVDLIENETGLEEDGEGLLQWLLGRRLSGGFFALLVSIYRPTRRNWFALEAGCKFLR